MTTTFTPGPWLWEVVRDKPHLNGQPRQPIAALILRDKSIPVPQDDVVLAVREDWMGHVKPEHAALIAAAPELAKALETMLTPLARHPEESAEEYANRLLEVRNVARAALAKAGVK